MQLKVFPLYIAAPLVVIGSCVANAALHNQAQPPMGNIMLKVAGVGLAFFNSYVALGSTANLAKRIGFNRGCSVIAGFSVATYVLYFAFRNP